LLKLTFVRSFNNLLNPLAYIRKRLSKIGQKRKPFNTNNTMKKLFALLAFVAICGAANAQCQSAAAQGSASKQETMKCSEADKAKCEKTAAQTGAKCETTGAVATEKSCSSAKAGSCCSKGTTSAGSSCCQKGGTAEAAPADGKKAKKVKTIAMVEEPKK
jgi:hypothetical protein